MPKDFFLHTWADPQGEFVKGVLTSGFLDKAEGWLIARHMSRRPTAAGFELAAKTIGRCLRDPTLARSAVAIDTTGIGGRILRESRCHSFLIRLSSVENRD